MSCFPDRLPPTTLPPAPLALVLALAGLGAGCRPEEVFETPLLIAPPFGDRAEQRCFDPDLDGDPDGIDLFFVDILAFDGQVAPSLRTTCEPCYTGEVDCPLVARACRCAGPRFDPDGVRDALTGIRLPDLDPDQPYCVRFVGARVGHGQGSPVGPGEVCRAPSACELAQVPEADLRVCSISDVVTLSRSETPILVDQTTCQACPPGPPALCGNLFRIPSCAGFGE